MATTVTTTVMRLLLKQHLLLLTLLLLLHKLVMVLTALTVLTTVTITGTTTGITMVTVMDVAMDADVDVKCLHVPRKSLPLTARLRARLNPDAVSRSDRRARFVGQAAYEAANTLQNGLLAGVNFMLHTAGWLEGGLAMSDRT